MKKAILYVRVSTEEQTKGYSQRSQEETLLRYCSINNYHVLATYIEDASAKTFERPQFNKMLLQLRKFKHSANLILFTKWDRFSRNAADAYQMIKLLNNLGAEPQAVEQPLDLEIPENKIMLAFYLASPEVENDRRALNVIAGQRRAQKEGRCMGKAPFGYDNLTTPDGRRYIAPNKDAPMAKWIFEQLATGKYTSESILKKAQERGFNLQKNGFWTLLRNPIYMGKIIVKAYKTEAAQMVQGLHTAIISEALFYDVQAFLDGRRRYQVVSIGAPEKFPLRGSIICSKDGRLLTASSSRGRKQYYDYYHCSSACGVRFKAEIVNNAMIKELQKYKPDPAVKELYKLTLKDVYDQAGNDRNKTINSLKEEINRLNSRESKARELMLSDSIEADDFRTIKKECEQGIIKAEQQIADMNTFTNIQPLIEKSLVVLETIDSLYTSGNAEVKRNIVGSMFPEKLEFDGEHFRTTRVNEAVKLIYNVGMAFSQNKRGQKQEFSALSSWG
ncbi:recombinase family protein [Ferruginibacter profundus]